MSIVIKQPSDAELYCRKDEERERFYEIFFSVCRKYAIHWPSASPAEKLFAEEVTRVTYERDKAIRLGLDLASIRPAFVS